MNQELNSIKQIPDKLCDFTKKQNSINDFNLYLYNYIISSTWDRLHSING